MADETTAKHFNSVSEEGLRGLTGESGALVYAEYILAKIRPPVGARILDLGCGDGRVLSQIAAIRPDLQCVGFDFADAQIAKAKTEALSNMTYHVVDLKSEIPRIDPADIAFSFSVAQYFTMAELCESTRNCMSSCLSAVGIIYHLSIPDLSKRVCLFHDTWLNFAERHPAASAWNLLKMTLVDAKRRTRNDNRYGGSFFHDAGKLVKLYGSEFLTEVQRPSDSWYRFDLVVKRP